MINLTELNTVAELLNKTGSIYLTEDKSLYEKEQWCEIEAIIFSPDLPWEKVTIGDADEPNDVDVGRFMTDIDQPRLVNQPLGGRLLHVLGSEKVISYCERLLGASKLFIRRVQVNRMHQKSFIGLHLDQDSNPDYELSIVLQLGWAYSGGEFVVHLDNAKRFSYAPSYRSMLISRCDLPHEVLEVTGGNRITLVFFLSRQSGRNQRKRAA